MFFVTAPSLDTTGWSAAALAQIEKIQQKERERQKKEEDMRLLQLKATSSKKRSSDEIPEQLEKRVRPKTSSTTVIITCPLSFSFSRQFKTMEKSMGKLSEAQKRTEKYQREQANSLKQLVELQKQA